MSDNQYADILDDNEDLEPQAQEPSDGPKALREALKKEAQKRKELEAELNEIRKSQRESELKSKLAAAGLPENAAKFVAGAEDVDAAIEEFRGLFGGAGATQQQDIDNDSPKGEPNLSEEQRSDIQALQGVARNNYTPDEAYKARLDEADASATSLDDLIGKVNTALRQ
ncbi:hypothetical protein [Jiangella anatolica]|uniref:Scaffolding protein n=1 Tax=Jiangella anatolica TaxID=2670374 RepID=A0A2W2B9D8_9ACTN|nr:hypothetical protein [Jiangella anatolica]PZF84161.1 hypothetical protein C1I92_09940 [Jiangella anatolica]